MYAIGDSNEGVAVSVGTVVSHSFELRSPRGWQMWHRIDGQPLIQQTLLTIIAFAATPHILVSADRQVTRSFKLGRDAKRFDWPVTFIGFTCFETV
jgi:hypothetical protein